MTQCEPFQASIEAALEKVCDLLPATVKTECDDFVKHYGPVVINLLVHELAPKVVCTALGLCAGNKAQLGKIAVAALKKCFTLSERLMTVVVTVLEVKVCAGKY